MASNLTSPHLTSPHWTALHHTTRNHKHKGVESDQEIVAMVGPEFVDALVPTIEEAHTVGASSQEKALEYLVREVR